MVAESGQLDRLWINIKEKYIKWRGTGREKSKENVQIYKKSSKRKRKEAKKKRKRKKEEIIINR